MRDNKPLEQEALNLSCYKVSKFDYKYSHPNSDENGGDFLILEEHTNELFKVIKCQSKGRNITNNNSNLKIHKSYVTENFIVFLYLKDEKFEDDIIYLFTQNDIEKWKINNDCYSLNLPKNSIETSLFNSYIFNKNSSTKIREILNNINNDRLIDYKTITTLDTLGNLFKIWKKIGSIPDYKLLVKILEDFDNYSYLHLDKFIFLLSSVIYREDIIGFEHSIDWSFQYLKMYNEIELESDITSIKVQSKISPTFMVTYNRTYLYKISNKDIEGFLLEIGDEEERFICYIFRNGEYSLKYENNK